MAIMQTSASQTFLILVSILASSSHGAAKGAPADLSSPMDAAQVFAQAMDKGDFDAAMDAAAGDQKERALIQAMTRMTATHRRLALLAESKFGPAGKKLGGAYADPGIGPAVGRSKLSVKGDLAVLREQPGVVLLRLTRMHGEWRVDIRGSIDASTFEQIPLLERASLAAEHVADDISRGTIHSVAEAKEALENYSHPPEDVKHAAPSSRPAGAAGSPRSTEVFLNACAKGSPEEVAAMIKAGADVNASGRSDGDTPLMRAAQHNPNPGVIAALVAAGADVDAKRKDGATALMDAVGSDNPKLEVVEALVKAGANVNAKDEGGDTALSVAAIGGLGNAKSSKLDLVTALLKAGSNGDSIDAALFRAAQMNDDPGAIAVLAKAGGNVNMKDTSGLTLLMDAVIANPGAVGALLKAGADVNAKNEQGSTALMFAADHQDPNMIAELLKAGADVNAKSNDGSTALIHAADQSDPGVVAALLKAGADANAKGRDGSTPIMHVAGAAHPSLDVMAALLKAGADINARNQKGETALEIARAKQDVGIETALIKAGANGK